MVDVAKNLKEVLGHLPEGVELVAISKYHPNEYILPAYEAGQRIFGESHEQELRQKVETLPKDIQWHFIGHLQTNKVKYIIDKVDCIQSVDSVKLAKEISRLAEKIGRKMPVLIEVNIGGEESKGGIEKAALPELLEEIAVLPGIQVNGLMAIPPICAEKSALCNYFSQMHQSFIDIRAKKIDNVFMNCLSMGMSSDYAEAIECGATMVRIGSSLFGPRDYTR